MDPKQLGAMLQCLEEAAGTNGARIGTSKIVTIRFAFTNGGSADVVYHSGEFRIKANSQSNTAQASATLGDAYVAVQQPIVRSRQLEYVSLRTAEQMRVDVLQLEALRRRVQGDSSRKQPLGNYNDSNLTAAIEAGLVTRSTQRREDGKAVLSDEGRDAIRLFELFVDRA